VRHAEIMQLHGAWTEAMHEFERGGEVLLQHGDRAAGAALYQLGELYRLRGKFAEAEEAYRVASEWGRTPQPGLAQLRLAQGRLDTASAAIRGAMEESRGRRTRPGVLGAAVDILLAAEDVVAARTAADELSNTAGELDSPFLRAVASRARGAVLLAEGDASNAGIALRNAWAGWQELGAPYEAARTRVLLGMVCRALGDEDAAALELDAARKAFESLGAEPDLNRLQALQGKAGNRSGGALTSREVEVLRLVAAGRTNRMIAGDLDISEKTVARHVSNIFMKLGLSSRAAATAYAYTHDLV
jgi:DNA-binding CsgD family transcriptional regulator